MGATELVWVFSSPPAWGESGAAGRGVVCRQLSGLSWMGNTPSVASFLGATSLGRSSRGRS